MMKGFELGINFIVVVVIGVLILTLGIAWIQGVFDTMTKMTTEISEMAHQQLVEKLKSGEKIGFTTSSKYFIKREESGKFEVGVNNEGYDGRCFNIHAVLTEVGHEVLSKYGCSDFRSCASTIREDVKGWLLYSGVGWINSQDMSFVIVDASPSRTVATGRYIFKFYADYAPGVTSMECRTYTGDFEEEYASKQLDIEIR